MDGAEVVVWGKRKPAVADVAEEALGIEFANIRVFGEKTVALRESIWVLGRALVNS